MLNEVVELKFKGERRELFDNPQNLSFKVGDFAVVQADKGLDFGRINHISGLLRKKTDSEDKLKKIVRKPNQQDIEKYEENKQNELSALRACKDLLRDRFNLRMRLVDCEYQFDRKKITFHFTSEKRVDFRELVKEVARVYKTRIEFRQISAREESRRLGGYGVCGRHLCCSSWIKAFPQVSTQAAKDQNISLNPTKLAGVCGKLKCCLMYERDFYNSAIKEYPQLAKPITTERGDGIVKNIDIFAETVTVVHSDDSTEIVTLAYLKQHVYKCENDCGHEHGNLQDLSQIDNEAAESIEDLQDEPDEELMDYGEDSPEGLPDESSNDFTDDKAEENRGQ
jgi:cell fate regulator YaaT (PSP1 superfamily)